MNCIVIDNDDISKDIMQGLVEQVKFLNLIKVCSHPMEALNVLKEKKIDLLLLDIEIPGMNGLELIKSLENPPLIILATAKKEYAIEAFECNVIDYLVKPITLERFLKAVSKAKVFFEGAQQVIDLPNKDSLYVKFEGILTKIDTKDIVWIEVSGDYITISTIESNYVVHCKMKTIENKLSPDKFVRVHRSFIVAIDHIHSIQDSVINLGKKLIPIGAMYKDNLMNRLNLL